MVSCIGSSPAYNSLGILLLLHQAWESKDLGHRIIKRWQEDNGAKVLTGAICVYLVDCPCPWIITEYSLLAALMKELKSQLLMRLEV